MTKKKPDLPEGDDGRTIANMNVEGMPWYSPGSHQAGSEKKEKTNTDDSFKVSLLILISPVFKKRINSERNRGKIKMKTIIPYNLHMLFSCWYLSGGRYSEYVFR